MNNNKLGKAHFFMKLAVAGIHIGFRSNKLFHETKICLLFCSNSEQSPILIV